MKRTVPYVLLIILLTVLVVGCGGNDQSQTIPEVTQTQFMDPPEDLRGFCYCEVIPVFQDKVTYNVEIYNTLGLNDCPADLWNQLDAEALSETYSAEVVNLNGPRYWVLNGAIGSEETTTGKVIDINGIQLMLMAQIETKVWESAVGESFYTDNEVQRTTSWIYNAGNMIYELTSAEGEVYRMQSYAQIVDSTLTISDLETLGDRLDLPEGWTYQARVLTEDSELKADGLAYVINDNLYNSYQKVLP